MQWQDEGIIIHSRKYGERKSIISIFTKDHGKHKGVFSVNKKNKSICETGNINNVRWSARLEEQLGSWKLENIYSPTAIQRQL